jgi:alcohol dehydrogenase
MSDTFQAMIVEEREGVFTRRIGSRAVGDLPAGEVRVRVHYSSLNYKDALSASGNRGVTKRYPHTPGIDAAGVVEASTDPAVGVGSAVLVTGYDLGMNTSGGMAEYIRVPAAWVVPCPAGMSLRDAMAFGSAGFTAALMVDELRAGGLEPGGGPVLVTGATGGVGCVAVTLLAHLGYEAVACTGKAEFAEKLVAAGARRVLSRAELLERADRMLLSARWAGAIDTVGGAYLDAALRGLQRGATVVACGMAASPVLQTNVFPFILRGVRLQGMDAAEVPAERRRAVWANLAGPWRPPALEALVRECRLDDVGAWMDAMLAGRMWGRMVVKIRAEHGK